MHSPRVPDRRPLSARLAESLSDRFAAWRDRTIASPRFQRLAADLPFTRPVARRRAAGLFDLCAGFVYSQVLLACVRLGLFDHLAEGPLPAGAIAAATGLDAAATERLLAAAASLDLVERRAGGRWGLGMHGAALRGNPGLAAMIEHHALVYRDLQDPVALLKGEATTALAGFWRYGEGADAVPDGTTAAAYSALMSATQGFVRDDVMDAFRFGRHRAVMDVGGGDGTFLAALARRHPHLRLTLFDLPPVAALAAARFEAEGLAGRARAVPGDFRHDRLPDGADLVTLVRVLHDHDDDTVRQLLSAVRRGLRPGARLLVAEPMAGTPGLGRVGDAYFGFYLMAMGRGLPRTAERIGDLLRTAGFDRIRPVRTRRPMLVSMMLAEAGDPPT